MPTDVNKSSNSDPDFEEELQQQLFDPTQESTTNIDQPIAKRTRKQVKQAQDKQSGSNHTQNKAKTHFAVSATAFIANVVIPQTVEEALALPDKEQWEQSMNSELKALEQNNTHWWNLLLIADQSGTGGFRIKTNPDGSLDKYKAELVIKGCSLREDIDFDQTYSPVARLESVRILLSIAAANDFELYQMDVKSAFLNGKLEELIFMEKPIF